MSTSFIGGFDYVARVCLTERLATSMVHSRFSRRKPVTRSLLSWVKGFQRILSFLRTFSTMFYGSLSCFIQTREADTKWYRFIAQHVKEKIAAKRIA